MYNFYFHDDSNNIVVLVVDINKTTINDLIKLYFQRIEKGNLMVDNIENIYFMWNLQKIKYENNDKKISSCLEDYNTMGFQNQFIYVHHGYSKMLFKNFKIIELIKDNVYSSVHKAEVENNAYPSQYVAIKKIKKEQLKEDIKENLCVDEITEEDFKKEISKFNKELKIMQICHCENSVEIYDYFDTEKEFMTVMELCDSTLFKELSKTKKGFNGRQIKEILLQLNNVFKKLLDNNIAHRDIKLNNILIKYLNKDKTKFKVLLSDYGVSNQLESMTGKFHTNTGTKIFMAPEILKGEEYNNKCDLWSLGVNIYQLYTKKPPYTGQFDNHILNQINKLGQTVLDIIKEKDLKDLLKKMLVSKPEKRISWKEYFYHNFFN